MNGQGQTRAQGSQQVQGQAQATPVLDRAGIAAVLPHRGEMCLIDTVDRWSTGHIVCSSDSHRQRPHPLAREDGSLGAACGIEYAAQAMALHAALTARAERGGSGSATGGLAGAPAGAPVAGPTDDPGDRLPVGMLAGVRALELHCARLDELAAPLRIEARLESGDPRTAVYGFTLAADDRPLVEGRATVILDATGLLP